MLDDLRHIRAGRGGGLLVNRRARKAAVAGGAVEVTRGVAEIEHGAHGLRAGSFLVG